MSRCGPKGVAFAMPKFPAPFRLAGCFYDAWHAAYFGREAVVVELTLHRAIGLPNPRRDAVGLPVSEVR
jgi:hypothetical protein